MRVVEPLVSHRGDDVGSTSCVHVALPREGSVTFARQMFLCWGHHNPLAMLDSWVRFDGVAGLRRMRCLGAEPTRWVARFDDAHRSSIAALSYSGVCDHGQSVARTQAWHCEAPLSHLLRRGNHANRRTCGCGNKKS
jgi:hypothetical protein